MRNRRKQRHPLAKKYYCTLLTIYIALGTLRAFSQASCTLATPVLRPPRTSLVKAPATSSQHTAMISILRTNTCSAATREQAGRITAHHGGHGRADYTHHYRIVTYHLVKQVCWPLVAYVRVLVHLGR